MSGPPTVLVMAKAPRPGSVKTRLHALLGPHGCARLQAALLQHTVATALDTGHRVAVAFDPPGARAEIEALIAGRGAVTLIPQRGGHLGERMTAAADDALADGGPLVVIGTDAPTLTAALLDRALTALTPVPSHREQPGFSATRSGGARGEEWGAVIGPALDGGYYLLGLHWPAPDAFAIDPALWGGEQVAAATVARLRRRPGRVTRLPALRDLDTPEDAAALIRDPALPPAIARVLYPERAAVTGR